MARLRYIGAGLAVDEDTGDLHFYVLDALIEFGWPDCPENRERAEHVVRQVVAERWPGVEFEGDGMKGV